MAFGKKSKWRSPNSRRADAVQVNCVQTVRMEPQCKQRRAKGVEKVCGVIRELSPEPTHLNNPSNEMPNELFPAAIDATDMTESTEDTSKELMQLTRKGIKLILQQMKPEGGV